MLSGAAIQPLSFCEIYTKSKIKFKNYNIGFDNNSFIW